MKKIAVVLLVVVLLSAMLVACDTGNKNSKAEPYIYYDLSSDIGLYFFNDNVNDYVRFADDISQEYFDKSKPTMVIFHGWMTTSLGEGEIYLSGLQTCSQAQNVGAPYIDYVASFKAQGYNVCAMDYSHHASDLFKLFEYIWAGFEDSHSIACRFAGEYAHCFEDYSQEVRFWGHSYGAQSSIATAYLLYKMANSGLVARECLPKRITIADPYIGDMTVMFSPDVVNLRIDNINEGVNGRVPTEVVADAMEYLNNQGVTMDIYCAMPMAYDQYLESKPQQRMDVMKKLHDNSVWTVLWGCQRAFGQVGDIHMIAEAWMYHSYFADVKTADDEYLPTAGLSTQEMRKLVGRTYKTTYIGFDMEKENIEEMFYDYTIQEDVEE